MINPNFTSHRFHRKECCGVFLLAFLLIFLKMPDRILHGFLWAEDISVFIKDAYEQGFASLEIPYAGYLHLIPRLLAYAQSFFFTITTAPYFFVLATALLTALCSAYIFDAARRYFTSFDDNSTFFLQNLQWHQIADDLCAQLFFVTPPTDFFLGRACILLLPFLIILSIAHCGRRSLPPLAVMITGLELWCVSIFIRQVPAGVTVHIGPCDCNARYYFAPAVLLTWSLILCIRLSSLKKNSYHSDC